MLPTTIGSTPSAPHLRTSRSPADLDSKDKARGSPFLLISRVLGAVVAIMLCTIILSFILTYERTDHTAHPVTPAEFGLRKGTHFHSGTKERNDQLLSILERLKNKGRGKGEPRPSPPTPEPEVELEPEPEPEPQQSEPAERPPPRPRPPPTPPPRKEPTVPPLVTSGKIVQPPRLPVPAPSDELTKSRQLAVMDAFKHAWKAYENRCFGQDELHPRSNTCSNWLNQGLTIVDSLDTIWLMGMRDEFAKAREWVSEHLHFQQSRSVSFFETTIRILGGLLSAYDLSRDQIFLDKASDLGARLAAAFETPSGLPRGEVNLANRQSNNPGWTGGSSLLAEVGTVQLEFAYLSKHNGNPIYAEKALKVLSHMDKLRKSYEGLYPIYIDPNSGQFTNGKITFGAMGDSFYEYLLKIWILTGKKNDDYKRMYLESVRGMKQHLLTQSPDGLWYLADLEGNHKQHKMDHLVCFAPAMLALGVMHQVVTGAEADDHLKMARDLCETCYQMYERSPSGIGAEYVNFNPNMNVGAPDYHLRPEAVEAIFLLWRATGEDKYRDQGWKMFQSIERHCRLNNGYTGLRDVQNPNSKHDKMESFFLAETLKYLFLLYSPDDAFPLDGPQAKVFNTECHALTAWDISS